MPARFTLTSPSIEGREMLAMEHTCDGNATPPWLEWSHAPRETRSFVLRMDELGADGDPVTHWLVWDIPATLNTTDPMRVDSLGTIGRNDFHDIGYRGPCPRRDGREHRYRISLLALDVASLELEEGSTPEAVEEAMDGHVIDIAELLLRYARGPVLRPTPTPSPL